MAKIRKRILEELTIEGTTFFDSSGIEVAAKPIGKPFLLHTSSYQNREYKDLLSKARKIEYTRNGVNAYVLGKVEHVNDDSHSLSVQFYRRTIKIIIE